MSAQEREQQPLGACCSQHARLAALAAALVTSSGVLLTVFVSAVGVPTPLPSVLVQLQTPSSTFHLNPKPLKGLRVMYGVFTCAAYHEKLEAQLDTWAARPRAQGLFLAVAGRGFPPERQVAGSVVAVDCDDSPRGNSCKEASLILEAARRNASWLVLTGDDNYVDTVQVEASLRSKVATDPIGMGLIGCGQGLPRYGPLVARNGGLCGGGGEILSGAAVQRLAAAGQDALLSEYGDETQCDMSTSGALLRRGIPLTWFPGRLNGMPIYKKDQIKGEIRAHGVTFHYVAPKLMRWLHAAIARPVDEERLRALEAEAFEGNCVRFFGHVWEMKRRRECQLQ